MITNLILFDDHVRNRYNFALWKLNTLCIAFAQIVKTVPVKDMTYELAFFVLGNAI